MSVPLKAGRIWGMPIALSVLSAVGLFSALLGDGIWDAVSWVALSLPILALVWFVALRSPVVSHH